MELRAQVEQEAAAVQAAVPQLTDAGVASALSSRRGPRGRARPTGSRRRTPPTSRLRSHLDEGMRDRLRLDAPRIADLAQQLRELAALPPLERDEERGRSRTGCAVTVRRIPIGVVGANFEARPNVAVDVAGQLLKSLNAVHPPHRRGRARARSRPRRRRAAARPGRTAGVPPEAVGLVRSPDARARGCSSRCRT